MKDSGVSFFRKAATRAHSSNGENFVLPTFVSPLNFILLWMIFLVVVLASVVAVHQMTIPVYAYGPSVAFTLNDVENKDENVAMAVLLPPEYKREIHEGQRVVLRLDQGSKPIVRHVSEFDKKVVSPEVAQRRYALSDGAASVITQPVVVAVVPLGKLPNGVRTTEYVGGVYAADIEVGSRTALSMFKEPLTQLVGGLL